MNKPQSQPKREIPGMKLGQYRFTTISPNLIFGEAEVKLVKIDRKRQMLYLQAPGRLGLTTMSFVSWCDLTKRSILLPA